MFTSWQKDSRSRLLRLIINLLINSIMMNSHNQKLQRRSKNTEIKIKIHFTQFKMFRYINSSNQLCKIPSTKTIRRVMKEDLKLRYRRISWRQLKNHGSDLKMQRAHYIMFWREIEKKWINIVQIDEFAINRDINPKMAWIKRGSPSYAIQETISKRFSRIWAIKKSIREMLTVKQ